MSTFSLTARCLFPVDGLPIANGIISIRDGLIERVDPAGTRAADRDLGNVALVPGLVNAHTHLDLSGLRGKCPPTPDVTEWLRGVIQHRRGQLPEQVEGDIRTGLAECLHFGTTLIGDIAAGGMSWPTLASASARAVVFHELLGLPQTRADAALETARCWLGERSPTQTCRAGLSPHAPYSVRVSLFSGAARLASQQGVPLATHLAETPAELDLLKDRVGPFVDLLTDLGVWDAEGLAASPRQIVKLCGDSESPLLLVHGNYLDVRNAIPRNASIIYCPRTHAAFGHPPHPFRDFLARGVRVAIGTDSLASNPDLDVLAEIRFLHHLYPDFPGAALLRMATLSGAEALGWADETGSLTPGKSADMIVLPLPDEDSADPYRLVFESDRHVTGVMFRGQWVREP